MMEKLLHERLKERLDGGGVNFFVDDCPCIIKDDVALAISEEIERCYIPREQYVKEMESKATDHMRTWAKERDMPFVENEIMGEWLDRWFIPRPRFEDGEPVQFGDEFIIDRYMREPEVLARLAIFTKEQLEEWEQYYWVAPVYEMNFHRPNCEDGKEPIIKRPQPKVLDADGVEIKVGDTVWDIKCHNCVKHTVIDIIHDDDCIICDDKLTYTAHLLTHKEPDSLEKLCDDVAKWLQKYTAFTPYEAVESIGEEIIERIGKLIERSNQ